MYHVNIKSRYTDHQTLLQYNQFPKTTTTWRFAKLSGHVTLSPDFYNFANHLVTWTSHLTYFEQSPLCGALRFFGPFWSCDTVLCSLARSSLELGHVTSPLPYYI
jgi:hypothetical protein